MVHMRTRKFASEIYWPLVLERMSTATGTGAGKEQWQILHNRECKVNKHMPHIPMNINYLFILIDRQNQRDLVFAITVEQRVQSTYCKNVRLERF